MRAPQPKLASLWGGGGFPTGCRPRDPTLYPPGEAAYLKAIEIDPRHVNARVGLGTLLTDKGDLAGAESAFLKAN